VTIASVDSKNSIQVLKVRYKKTTDSTWTEQNLTTGVEATITLDKLFEWNIEIVITDKFGTTTYTATVAKGIPIMFLDNVKLSVGIGMFPSGTETLEVADQYLIPLMKKVYAVGDIMMTTTSANPNTRPQLAGTTWAAWGAGRVPIGVGSNGETNYTTGEATGGWDNVALTQAQLPQFQFGFGHHGDEGGSVMRALVANNIQSVSYGNQGNYRPPNGAVGGAGSISQIVWTVGNNQSHENRSKWITCYFWKRTA
jgi:hypothetical protein